jgi:hypothetical protein
VSQNRWEDEVGAGHASRSSSLLHVKANRARVFQFGSKLTDARRQVVHVASSRRLHRDEVEDGRIDATDCVRFSYPYFIIFNVLD